MIVMYDSIELDQFPADPQAVAGYTSGNWPTYDALLVKFPHAYHLSIAVAATHYARCLDVEPGDASPAQAPGWFRAHANHSEGVPVLYGSASSVQTIIDTMAAAGIARSQYLIWSAHYTFAEHVCSPSTCGYPSADATQWTDKAMGRNLDQSICRDYFFDAAPAPVPQPPTEDQIMAIATGTNKAGAFHVFVEAQDGSVWYTYQRPGETSWEGGKAGVSVADLKPFAPAPK